MHATSSVRWFEELEHGWTGSVDVRRMGQGTRAGPTVGDKLRIQLRYYVIQTQRIQQSNAVGGCTYLFAPVTTMTSLVLILNDSQAGEQDAGLHSVYGEKLYLTLTSSRSFPCIASRQVDSLPRPW